MSGSVTPRGAWIVMFKELRLLFKSKRRILLLFMIPVLIILIALFSAASTNWAAEVESSTVTVTVVDENPSPYSADLLNLWETTINDTVFIEAEMDYKTLLDQGNFNVLAFIPSNFSTQLTQNLTASVAVTYNGNATRNSIIASQMVQLTTVYESILVQSSNPDINFNLIVPQLESYHEEGEGVPSEIAEIVIIIPVYIIVFVVIPPVSLIMISVTIEREQRTLEVLFLQPVTRRSIVLGKILYGLSLVLFTAIMDFLAAIISYFLFINIADIDTDGEIGSVIQDIVTDLGPLPFIGFFLSIVAISFIVIALAVLLSLLAKDEKEANMITGLIPLFLFIVIAIVFVVPLDELSFVGQLIWTSIPMMGVIIAIYLSTLAGEVILLGWISLIAQFAWSIILVLVTARVSEAESIIELTWGKAIRELIRVILRR